MNETRPITIQHTGTINKLKRIRVLSGLSQKELSERSGVPLKCIGNYEQDRRNLNHARGDILYYLSKALNCTIEDLLTIE